MNLGLDGTFGSENTYDWNIDYVHSENKAEQTFFNGFNIGKVKLALGDPTVCAASPGCVPLDLFGGQGRPMTQDMGRGVSVRRNRIGLVARRKKRRRLRSLAGAMIQGL